MNTEPLFTKNEPFNKNNKNPGLSKNTISSRPAVKSTASSSYNPNIKEGRGGTACDKGPEVWVKRWVDYSSK